MLSNSREPISDEFSMEDERYMAITSGVTSRLSMKNQYSNAVTVKHENQVQRTKTPVQNSALLNQTQANQKLNTIKKYTN